MHSLNMLARQRIPKSRVTLFVASESERRAYRGALQGSAWADVRIAARANELENEGRSEEDQVVFN